MKKLMKKEKEKMRLQRNFLHNEIKRLNKKYNVHMFTTKIRDVKAFIAGHKVNYIRQNLQEKLKKRIKSKEIIGKAINNMNNTQSEKYDLEPEVIEKFKVQCFQNKI